MPLSDNSTICVCFGLVVIDWQFYSPWIMSFLCLAGFVIFNWIPEIVYFTWLGAGYFWSLMNVPELCSGLGLVYLPAAWSFLVLPLWFIKWVWSSVYFKNDDFPLLKQDSPDRSNQRPWITSFSRVAGGKGRSSHRVTVAATVPSTPFGWFTSQPVARALTTAVRSAGGGPHTSGFSPGVSFPSPALHLRGPTRLGLTKCSTPSPALRDLAGSARLFPLGLSWDAEGREPRQPQVSAHFLPISRWSLSLIIWGPVL